MVLVSSADIHDADHVCDSDDTIPAMAGGHQSPMVSCGSLLPSGSWSRASPPGQDNTGGSRFPSDSW